MNNITYQTLIKEYFDIMDKNTRQILLSINEADQDLVLSSLASRLYQSIIKKVDDIDFGDIPKSRGDITKVTKYPDMIEALDTIRELIIHYKQPTTSIDSILEAIENIKDSQKLWEKAFNINSELPIVMYNTLVLSIVSATSIMISTSIDFIKDPGDQTFELSLNKTRLSKSKDYLLFKNLSKFNKSYKKKEIEKTVTALLKAERAVAESNTIDEAAVTVIIAGIIGTATIISLLMCVIPFLNELTSFLYCAKQNVSDYFDIQSSIVRLNAENLKYDYTKTEDSKKKIYDKQVKIANTFKKISNAFAIKLNKAEGDANMEIKQFDDTRYNINDVTTTRPDSASSIF